MSENPTDTIDMPGIRLRDTCDQSLSQLGRIGDNLQAVVLLECLAAAVGTGEGDETPKDMIKRMRNEMPNETRGES